MKLQCVMIIIAVLFSGNCLKLVLAGATGIKFNSYFNFFLVIKIIFSRSRNS